MDRLRAHLGRLFNLHPEDWRPLLLLQALIVFICMVIASTKTVANSLFVCHVGVKFLPYTYMASAVALIVSGFFLIPLIDKFPRLRIYRITSLSLSGLFALSFLAMLADQTWVYYLVYLLASMADSILFLEFWLIASDLCDARQAKRVFPLVIGWSLIGGIAGSFGTKFLVGYISTPHLLLVSAGLLTASLGIIHWIKEAFPRESAVLPTPKVTFTIGRWPRLKLDFRIVRESPLVRLICLSLVLYSILAFVIDFLFNAVSAQHFTVDGKVQVDRLTAFFGFFDGISITVAIVFQFLLVNRLLRVLGITNAQLVLPGMLGIGFSWILASALSGKPQAAFVPTLGTRLGQKFLSSSLHRSSMAFLYSPIPSEQRGRSKAFAESMVQPGGVLLAGFLILWIKSLPLAQVAGIALVFSAAYILLLLRVRKVYLRQILKMFEQKNFGVLESFAGMFAKLGEKEILEKLCDSLEDKDFNIRNFVVELLGQIKSKSAIDPLVDLYHSEENATVKATAVAVLGRLGTPRVAPLLREALGSGDARVRANAIEAIVASKNTELYGLIPERLADPNPRVCTNAAIAIWNIKMPNRVGAAIQLLMDNYRKGSKDHQLSALYAFGEIATQECVQILIEATLNPDKKILARAIASLGSTRSEKAMRTLMDLLPSVNSALQNLITTSLNKLAPTFPDLLIKSLHHPDIYSRRHTIAVAAMLDDKRVRDALTQAALDEIEAIHQHRQWQQKIIKIHNRDVQALLSDTFVHLNGQAKENILAILRVLGGNTPAIQRIIKDISHPNRFVRSAALDALEAVGHKTIAKAFVPILEEQPLKPEEADAADPDQILAWIRQWVKSPYRWIRACGTFAAGRLQLQALHEDLIGSLSDAYDLVRANAIEALAQLGASSNRIYIERMLKDPSPLPRRYAQALIMGTWR